MSSESAPAKTRILLVDDSRVILSTLTAMLSSAEDMAIVGTVSTGQDAIRRAVELNPDVILLDVNLPDKDGIQVAWTLSSQLPGASIIMITSEDSTALVQRAMLAGAQGYLIKPLKADDVLPTIRQVRARQLERVGRMGSAEGAGRAPAETTRPDSYGRRVLVFGPKGGVGKTTIAANLALALRVRGGRSVALVDADLSFGDVCLQLGLVPRTTIADVLSRPNELDSGLLSRVMVEHPSGVKVLAPPARPEEAELLKTEVVQTLLTSLARTFNYVVIDSHHSYDELNLALLDRSDLILLVLTPEMGPVRNAKRFLRLADTMGYGRERMLVVVNRANSKVGLEVADVEGALELGRAAALPVGGRDLVTCVNRGEPMVVSNPRSPWSKAMFELCDRILKDLPVRA